MSTEIPHRETVVTEQPGVRRPRFGGREPPPPTLQPLACVDRLLIKHNIVSFGAAKYRNQLTVVSGTTGEQLYTLADTDELLKQRRLYSGHLFSLVMKDYAGRDALLMKEAAGRYGDGNVTVTGAHNGQAIGTVQGGTGGCCVYRYPISDQNGLVALTLETETGCCVGNELTLRQPDGDKIGRVARDLSSPEITAEIEFAVEMDVPHKALVLSAGVMLLFHAQRARTRPDVARTAGDDGEVEYETGGDEGGDGDGDD